MNMGSEDVNEDLFGLEDEDFGEEINSRMNVTNISSGGSNQEGNSGRMFSSKTLRQKGLMDHFFAPNIEMVVQIRRSGKMNQTTINDAYKKEARERACMPITRWMYEAPIPFNAITYPSFQPTIEAIGQYGVGMKGPTLHEGTMFMQSIDASSMIKTKEKMFELLDKWVEQVGEKNVIQVIIDNHSSYVVMTAHYLNLMLEDIGKLPKIKTLERAYITKWKTTKSVTSGIRAQLRSGHSKGSMSGSNMDETSEQTRGGRPSLLHGARAGRISLVTPWPTWRARPGEGLRGSKGADPRPSRGVLGSQVQPVSHEEFMSFQDKVMSMFASVESRMEALAARMEARDQEIRQELAIYKTAVSARVMATHEAPRVEVPKPHTFSGKRDAKELDNFLWHMDATLRHCIDG
ncbi:hypothetical protein CK203_046332 [Vitis vinifera]|uniref:DUF659 domain-containing protein n=1 Tax=Vitis vinifera TaxID=29760 RepID=A0A438FWC3_VITVI|nr:hypothetical protein CK203_046332 [Vitis vinifera]